MRVIKAPEPLSIAGRSVFLAGSIDMGKAVNWQEQVTRALSGMDVTVLNPRRDDWDSSWVQDISDPQFSQQVRWELEAMERADVISMYFDPKGQAPITLAELGLHARSKKIVVCCPEGFWRRGNVQMICERYRVPLTESIETLIQTTKARLLFP